MLGWQRVRIPLVAADARSGLNDYAEAARTQCPMLLRLDAGRRLRFAAALSSWRTATEFHARSAFGPEANSVAGLHVALAQKPASYYEACFPRSDFEFRIDVPTRLDGAGRVAAPARGLGLEIDWASLERKISWIEAGPAVSARAA
jgi:hypothetical protein